MITLRQQSEEFVFRTGGDVIMKITPEGIFANGVQIGQRKHEAELIYEVFRQYFGPVFGGDSYFSGEDGDEARLEALRDKLCQEMQKGNKSGVRCYGVEVAEFEMPSVGR